VADARVVDQHRGVAVVGADLRGHGADVVGRGDVGAVEGDLCSCSGVVS
jgi:hypothetical protein